jgi:hypothetical protein
MATLQHPLARRLDDLAIRAARAMVASALQGIEADVVAAFDLHPGLAPLLADGRINALSEAVLALAMRFAEEARVPVFAGAATPQFLGELSRRNHALFSTSPRALAQHGVAPSPRPLAPVIERLGQHLLGPAWGPRAGECAVRDATAGRTVPGIALVVMGDRCADAGEAAALLRQTANLPIFWVFVTLAGPGVPPPIPGTLLGRTPEAFAEGAPFGSNWCTVHVPYQSDAGDLYGPALAGFAVWYDRWQRSMPKVTVDAVLPEDGSRNRLTRTVADERTQAVRARAERERERLARTLEDVERGSSWPRARGLVAKGRGGADAGPRARQLFTQPLVAPEWRLENARATGWTADVEEVGLPALSPTLTIEGERPSAAGPTESSADRLARIRARRLSRNSKR